MPHYKIIDIKKVNDNNDDRCMFHAPSHQIQSTQNYKATMV